MKAHEERLRRYTWAQLEREGLRLGLTPGACWAARTRDELREKILQAIRQQVEAETA